MEGQLIKYLGGFISYFLFINLQRPRVGKLQIIDVVVSECEAEWVVCVLLAVD